MIDQKQKEEFLKGFRDSEGRAATGTELKDIADKLQGKEADFLLQSIRTRSGLFIGLFKHEKSGVLVDSIVGTEGKSPRAELEALIGRQFVLRFLAINITPKGEYASFELVK